MMAAILSRIPRNVATERSSGPVGTGSGPSSPRPPHHPRRDREFATEPRLHLVTKAEETLLKEICYKGLEIRNARTQGRSPGSLVKEYQELMKTANVDPAKTAIAGSGKARDTFSEFIKTIEQNEPADYYEDQKLFKDFDNIDFYFKKYYQ